MASAAAALGARVLAEVQEEGVGRRGQPARWTAASSSPAVSRHTFEHIPKLNIPLASWTMRARCRQALGPRSWLAPSCPHRPHGHTGVVSGAQVTLRSSGQGPQMATIWEMPMLATATPGPGLCSPKTFDVELSGHGQDLSHNPPAGKSHSPLGGDEQGSLEEASRPLAVPRGGCPTRGRTSSPATGQGQKPAGRSPANLRCLDPIFSASEPPSPPCSCLQGRPAGQVSSCGEKTWQEPQRSEHCGWPPRTLASSVGAREGSGERARTGVGDALPAPLPETQGLPVSWWAFWALSSGISRSSTGPTPLLPCFTSSALKASWRCSRPPSSIPPVLCGLHQVRARRQAPALRSLDPR